MTAARGFCGSRDIITVPRAERRSLGPAKQKVNFISSLCAQDGFAENAMIDRVERAK
jgi:hypothetical protein